MQHFSLIFELEMGGKRVDLGDSSVSRNPSAVSITFRCEYPLDIAVTSEPFSVESDKFSGVQYGIGDLDEGFSLIIGDGTGRPVILGSMLNVSVQWDLKF